MGFSSSRNPGSVASGFLLLRIWILLLSTLTGLAAAIDFKEFKTQHVLNLDDLGRVGLGGNFNSVAPFQFAVQNATTWNEDGTHSVVVELPNGQFASIAKTDGQINDMCVFKLKNGDVAGLIVGGNFTKIANVDAVGVALIDPTKGLVVTLAGLTGSVNALLCDQETETVYVGGDFSGGNSTNAITWVGKVGWANMPFAGFNGPVNTIQKSDNGTIIFGGEFNAIGNSSVTVGGRGSGDTPKNNQFINLNTASVDAQLSTSQAGFNDPKNIICSDGTDTAGNAWLLQDNTYGSWSAQFRFTYVPSFVRLHNTHLDGRGTKTFSFISRPNNGIMNLTYIDPETKTQKYCDAKCPMSGDSSVEFQDFFFVDAIPMNAFDLRIWDFYGKGGGLRGLEIFSRTQMAFAVPDLNEATCKKIENPSSSETKGTWTAGGNERVDSEFLTAKLSGDALEEASVTFRPDVKKSGKYIVNLYTPGCEWDKTCDSRGRVNVTGFFTKDQTEPVTVTLSQTNPENKYDPIYEGEVDATTSDFRPEVILTPIGGQSGTKTVVAQKVDFVFQGGSGRPGSGGSRGNGGSGGSSGAGGSEGIIGGGIGDGELGGGSEIMNAIFEFDPKTIVLSNSDMPDNAVIQSGTNLEDGAVVRSVVVIDKDRYIGGDFTGDGISNIYSVSDDGVKSLAKGGLDAPVRIMRRDTKSGNLIVGGDFVDTASGSTKGLSHIAGYDVKKGEWFALGAGVNGPVEHIVSVMLNVSSGPTETWAISGRFTKILASNGNGEVDVQNTAVWVPQNSTWMAWMKNPTVSMEGVMSASAQREEGVDPFLAGCFLSGIGNTAGAVSLFNEPFTIESIGIKINTNSSTNSNSNAKRAKAQLKDEGVACGTFYQENKANLTILGGKFTAQGKDKKAIRNLAFIDGTKDDEVTGLPENSGLESDNVYKSLLAADGVLWVGGAISGSINDTTIGGIFGYDLVEKKLLDIAGQPAQLTGDEVAVYSITQKPGSKYVFVGGSFDTAGGNPCSGLCYFDADKSEVSWLRPGSGLSGTIYTSDWITTNTLLVGGDMRINGTTVYMATYDFNANSWQVFGRGSGDKIPGPVESFSVADENGDFVYASGSAKDGGAPFIMRWDNKSWKNIAGTALQKDSVVRNIQVLNIRGSHASNSYLQTDQVLLVTGELTSTANVKMSAVMFDGKEWTPFLLTTGAANQGSSIGPFFSQYKPTFKKNSGHLAVGLVVLISLAISLGLIFLIVVLGVLASWLRRRREGYTPAPTKAPAPIDGPSMQERLPPGDLFSSVGHGGGRAGAGGAPMI